jgi:tetratricopeptide (TPR) repeat protein
MKHHDLRQALVPALLTTCLLFDVDASFAQSGLSSAPIGPSLTVPVAPAGPNAAPAPQPAPAREAASSAAPSGALPSDEQRGAYEKAFQDTLGKPSDPEALAKFAELAVGMGDIEGAISALERLLLIDADQPEVKLELGVLYYRLGATEPARAYLEAARTSPSSSSETKARAETFLAAVK